MHGSDIHDSKALTAAVEQGYRPKFVFFWSPKPVVNGQLGKDCLSQWYAAPFTIEGITYPTAEHFMMAEKARLFGDEEIYKKILSAPGPDVAKKLGRLVRNFDGKIWSEKCVEIVIRGNEAKFGQNQPLQAFLTGTGDSVLVEASPYDQIWGIGMDENHPEAKVPKNWKGQNLLGFALMAVRSRLLARDKRNA